MWLRLLINMVSLSLILKMFDQKDFFTGEQQVLWCYGNRVGCSEDTTWEDEFLGKVELKRLCRNPRRMKVGGELADGPALRLTWLLLLALTPVQRYELK